MDQTPQALGTALLTPSEASRLLHVPETTLAAWRSTGRVQLAYVKVGRAVRYAQADIERFIGAQRHARDTL